MIKIQFLERSPYLFRSWFFSLDRSRGVFSPISLSPAISMTLEQSGGSRACHSISDSFLPLGLFSIHLGCSFSARMQHRQISRLELVRTQERVDSGFFRYETIDTQSNILWKSRSQNLVGASQCRRELLLGKKIPWSTSCRRCANAWDQGELWIFQLLHLLSQVLANLVETVAKIIFFVGTVFSINSY